MDEVVAGVKRCPNPMFGPSEIEIRSVYEFALTPRGRNETSGTMSFPPLR